MKRSNPRKSLRTDRPTLPELDQTKRSVLNSLASLQSRRSYQCAMNEFIDWYCSEPRLALNRGVVLAYRTQLESKQLAPATINVRLAAVRRLAYEAADSGLLSPELVTGIRRVKGVPQLGRRVGNWLTAEEGEKLLAGFNLQTLRGRRDAAIFLSCSAAICVGPRLWGSKWATSSAGKITGRSLTSWARLAMSARFLCRRGSRRRSTAGPKAHSVSEREAVPINPQGREGLGERHYTERGLVRSKGLRRAR